MSTESLKALTDGWLSWDLDAWTRHIVQRHFDPATGSAFWLKQRGSLDFDPLEITRYEELAAFGNFDLATLRDQDPADFVPQDVPRPLAGRVFESAGTTGKPCRVFYTEAMAEHWAAWRQLGRTMAGFEPGGTWLDACPSGPHLVGQEADQLADLYGSTVYSIDLDPRWIKTLIRGGRLAEMNAYVDHVIEQVTDILESRPVDYLRTTPAIVQALINRRPELTSRLKGVYLGGTQLTPDSYRRFSEALGGGVIGATYGNTFGNANGLPSPDGGSTLPYVPNYPHTTMAVVDKTDPTRVVEYGEEGRVRLMVLHEDLFLPNVLERDQALRYETPAEWPCDGVANVQPLKISTASPEGLY
ncbi:arylcarboxylate reductase [Peterkaempfera bronchialis]|uniref:Arylcarboxylate reductase n=1 Tax=Peterkaempfera bronchialis TaxID=2126346 RepID=A0A345T2T8_9ACTN|nr:arylcarboxylate reductase [Peterkaempfera bronchialis]AXI80293.1 arylcarboxylate reductase [Peterkaempfera bronchialis]